MNNPMHRYIIGFMLSLALTAIPLLLLWWYVGAHSQYLSRDMLYAAFVLCAVAQMWVQLYFFLHLGQEATPRWRSMALYFALVVVVLLMGGTLWIMHNLSYAHEASQPFFGNEITPQTEND